MNKLDGQVALVTGGGRGFGRAIAEALAAVGARVGVVARSTGQIDEVAQAITAAGGTAIAVAADVSDRAAITAAIAEVERRLGPISILVNNAGTPGPFGPIAETDPDDWWAAQKLHLYAPLLTTAAVLPGMLARGGGRIINVASRAAILFQPGLSAYVVGKTAQVGLTAHLDAEVRDRGVRAFAIQPGDAPTEFAHQTMRSKDAQEHLTGMLETLSDWVENVDPAPVLAKCGQAVVALAAGRYDPLAGRYLDVDWDWDKMIAEGTGEAA